MSWQEKLFETVRQVQVFGWRSAEVSERVVTQEKVLGTQVCGTGTKAGVVETATFVPEPADPELETGLGDTERSTGEPQAIARGSYTPGSQAQ